MFRSGSYDFPVVLMSQDVKKKFKLPATNHCDAIVENLKRDAVVLIQLTFDANEDSNVLKSAIVNVKPLRVSLEGLYTAPNSGHLKFKNIQKCDFILLRAKRVGRWQI